MEAGRVPQDYNDALIRHLYKIKVIEMFLTTIVEYLYQLLVNY